MWTAAWMAMRDCGHVSGNDMNIIFYIDDQSLARGLGEMAREKSLPGDRVSQLAERIGSYLARKVGASLDGETVDHVAKMIREIR